MVFLSGCHKRHHDDISELHPLGQAFLLGVQTAPGPARFDTTSGEKNADEQKTGVWGEDA